MEDSKTCEQKVVGRVVGLWRYPVKSMGAEALNEADVSWHGVAGDRRWAFIRNDSTGSGFPWFTLRERADMSHYQPSFVQPDRPNESQVMVRTPTGDSLEVGDAELGADLCPGGARVIKQGRGVFDTFPLSLITTQTVSLLSESVGMPLDVQRFRPNFLVEAVEDIPYPEDGWVGRTLRIGGMRMRIDQRDARCLVITIDPATGERKPEVLRAVAKDREGCLGVYGSTVEPGRVEVGDDVIVADAG